MFQQFGFSHKIRVCLFLTFRDSNWFEVRRIQMEKIEKM